MGSRPIPFPTAETRPFWDALGHGTLMLPRCTHCARISYPPRPRCPACWSTDLNWTALSGTGQLKSWTDIHIDVLPGVAPPFTIAEVELSEQTGLTMTALLIGSADNDKRTGAAVQIGFTTTENGVLPHFSIVGTAGSK